MASAANVMRVTATGDITTADSYLHAVTVSGGADAAAVSIRAGGSGGTVVLHLHAGANTSFSTGYLGDVYCGDGIHVTVVSGTTPSVSVVYA